MNTSTLRALSNDSKSSADSQPVRRGIRLPLLVAIVGVTAACLTVDANASDDGVPVVRVEEDWVIQIGIPSPEGDAPQIVNVMTPYCDIKHTHVVFELNHTTLPEYSPGGLMLQRWDGETDKTNHRFPHYGILAIENETITYTMGMSLSGGKLWFEVTDGHSASWGDFGGQGYLKTGGDSSLSHFDHYSPATSVKFSRIGYAKNRVRKMVLKQVRYYSADGLIKTDTQEKVVHLEG